MISTNRRGEVWVFAEQEDGSLHDVVLELCGKARELADRLGVRMGAVLPGANVAGMAGRLIAQGADRVYLVENQRLAHYQTATYAHVLDQLISKHSPQIVIFGATPLGRDLAPRVASALRAGMTADCTDLQISDVTDPKTKETHRNLLLQIRPAFGGNIIATIVNYDQWPQMATVREGVMPLKPADFSRQGEILREQVELDETLLAVKLLQRHIEPRKVNLKGARVIVAGGGGVGSKENFRLIHELAGAIGGAVGASRAAVDSGYIGKEHQIGQTGTTVRPALYIAAGISGAVQHRAGM
jgi:electron transfer flavoprotein alpha subunit